MRHVDPTRGAVGHRGRCAGVRAGTRVAITDDSGTIQPHIERLTPMLGRRGVSATVVTRKAHRGTASANGAANVVRIPGTRGGPDSSLSYAALGAAWIVCDAPHVVHARGMCSAATAAMAGTRVIRRPYVVTLLESGPHGDIARLRATPGGERRLARVARTAAAFVCVTTDAARDLVEIGIERERIVRVPLGVDIERFRPRRRGGPTPTVARAALGLPTTEPVTITVGPLSPDSRIDRVIAAHAAVPGTLVVVDGGPHRPALEDLARAVGVADRVRFRNADDDHAALLACVDAFVTAADDGGPHRAVLEAMASGLPVIAAGGGQLRGVVDGTTGVLLGPATPDEHGRATALLLDDRPRRSALGVAGRQRVVADHTLTRTADELAALYRRVGR